MTVCPVALAVGCPRCPAFAICPMTRILGDQAKAEPAAVAKGKKPTGKSKA